MGGSVPFQGAGDDVGAGCAWHWNGNRRRCRSYDPNLSVEDCIQAAVEDYNAKTALTPQGHEMRDKQRNIVQLHDQSVGIPGTVRVALDALRWMVPSGHGEKIFVQCH